MSGNKNSLSIPRSYLNGQSEDDFYMLSVVGDSMYPLFIDSDKLLIHKQSEPNESGSIAVVEYNSTIRLCKVEYCDFSKRLKLISTNPYYKPEIIEGEDLKHLTVVGVPVMLFRDID